MERETEDNSDEDDIEDNEHLGTYQAKSRQELECHNEKGSGEVLKCHKCDFNCESTTQFKKHMNTRHPSKLKDSDKTEEDAEEKITLKMTWTSFKLK